MEKPSRKLIITDSNTKNKQIPHSSYWLLKKCCSLQHFVSQSMETGKDGISGERVGLEDREQK